MKLIIDIDENVFTRLFDNGVDTNSDDREVIDRAIRNGMPYKENLQENLISRNALEEKIQEIVETEMPIDEKWAMGLRHSLQIIDNVPSVDITEEQAVDKLHETGRLPMHDKEMTERPQDNLTETTHRLNLLIGVLFSNQVISENDIEYIEDSIKKLMEGDTE